MTSSIPFRPAPEIDQALRQLAAEEGGTLNQHLIFACREYSRLKKYIDGPREIDKSPAPKKKKQPPAASDSVKRLFNFWRHTMGKPKAKLTEGRRKCIQARLNEGYTELQIESAIRGCGQSEHHMGINPQNTRYNDLTLICRSGEKLESFEDMWRRHEQWTKVEQDNGQQSQDTQDIPYPEELGLIPCDQGYNAPPGLVEGGLHQSTDDCGDNTPPAIQGRGGPGGGR